MGNQDVLSKLHDIVLPEPIGIWPLALGWYGVIFITLVLAFFLFKAVYQGYSRGLPKREALRLLRQYQKNRAAVENPVKAAAFISELLRRVALAYFPLSEVARLEGQDWIDFLNKAGQKINFTDLADCLLQLPFADPNEGSFEAYRDKIQQLYQYAFMWIKQRDKPCSN